MIQESNKNKRGAPLGNQNARTHGFYAKKLSKRERATFEAASNLKGLDQEITLVRTKIESIIDSDPENVPVLMLAISALVKLLKAKQMLQKDDPELQGDIVENALSNLAASCGLWPAYTESGDITMVKIQDAPSREGMAVIVEARKSDESNAQNSENRADFQA